MATKLPVEANELLKACGGNEKLAFFAVAYLKHKGDATAAYQEAIAKPGTTYESCKVNGSNYYRRLLDTNLALVLEARNLGWDRVLKKIDTGLEATKIVTSHTEPDYEAPDWGNQHKYMTTLVGLLKGGTSGDDAAVRVTGEEMTIEFTPK